MNTIQQALVSLTKAALFGKEALLPKDFEEKDYPQLYSCAKKNGVLAICLDGILMLPAEQQPLKPLKLQWIANVAAIEKRYEQKKQTLHKLADLFQPLHIPCLVFKGFALSRLYPNPKHREFGDIDIFLPNSNYDKGNLAVEKQGIHVHIGHHHAQFHIDHILVENHSVFLHERHSVLERKLELYAENEANLNPEQYPLYFSPLQQNAHFVHHAAHHFFANDCNIRLRTLCDWALILRDEGKTWKYAELKDWLYKTEAGHLADMMTTICIQWYGCELTKEGKHHIKHFDKKTQERFIEAIFAKKYHKRDEPHRIVRYLAHIYKQLRFSKMRKIISK